MESFVENTPPSLPGELLALERERQGLSCADVAQRLHMSVSQVEALESGDYARLPRGPFLRGFFRNYAKLLGIEPDSVLSLLADAAPRDPAPRIVVPSQNIRFEPLGDRLSSPYVKAASLAAVVLAIGFAAMYWWLFVRAPAMAIPKPAPAEAPAADAGKVPALAKVENAVPQAAAPAPAAPAMEPAKSEPSPQPPAETKAEPAGTAAAPAEARDGSLLRFRFGGESWVEVRDARGRVLLTGLQAPGSVAEVAGRPPLRVTVGNAAAVQVTHDGRTFDLAPHTRETVARFSIE